MKKKHLKLLGGKEKQNISLLFLSAGLPKNWFRFLHFKNNFICFIISIASLQYIEQWCTNIKFEFVFWKCAQLGQYLAPSAWERVFLFQDSIFYKSFEM